MSESLNQEEKLETTCEEEVEVQEETLQEGNEEVIISKKKRIEQLEAEVAKLQKELAESTNNYYKAYADAQNLKKRLQNEADQVRKYRIQGFASEVLPIIDNLERALSQKVEDEAIKNYVKGFEMIYQQLINALNNEGVKEIDSLNQPFDPNFHQALMQEAIEGVESGMVVEVLQKGYMLKDRVLRAALVKVSE